MMAFSVSYVEDADMEEVVNLLFDTFQHSQPAIDAMYPNHDTAKGRAETVARLRSRNTDDPMVHHLKVQDTASGKLLGQGTWFIKDTGMKSSRHTLEGPWWNSDNDREWANDLYEAYFRRRWQTFLDVNGPVFAISSMCVLPEYRACGAGSAFMQWGLERADSCGAECVVESAPGSQGFYGKHGFVQIESVNIAAEMPEKWKGRPEQRYTWMKRPTKSLS